MGARGAPAAALPAATTPPRGTAPDSRPHRALAGILYVLRTDVAWRDVPRQLVGCSGVTAWRRLRDWTEAGIWPRLHTALLTELRATGLLEMDDCAVDGSHVRALKGGSTPGRRRSTVAVPAASIICSSIGMAPRSRCR
jgi:transposase